MLNKVQTFQTATTKNMDGHDRKSLHSRSCFWMEPEENTLFQDQV